MRGTYTFIFSFLALCASVRVGDETKTESFTLLANNASAEATKRGLLEFFYLCNGAPHEAYFAVIGSGAKLINRCDFGSIRPAQCKFIAARSTTESLDSMAFSFVDFATGDEPCDHVPKTGFNVFNDIVSNLKDLGISQIKKSGATAVANVVGGVLIATGIGAPLGALVIGAANLAAPFAAVYDTIDTAAKTVKKGEAVLEALAPDTDFLEFVKSGSVRGTLTTISKPDVKYNWKTLLLSEADGGRVLAQWSNKAAPNAQDTGSCDSEDPGADTVWQTLINNRKAFSQADCLGIFNVPIKADIAKRCPLHSVDGDSFWCTRTK